MKEKLTPKELLKLLKQWQKGIIYVKREGKKHPLYQVHPFTCSDGGGECNNVPLKPEIVKNKVVLVCPRCERVQRKFPTTVLFTGISVRNVLEKNKQL